MKTLSLIIGLLAFTVSAEAQTYGRPQYYVVVPQGQYYYAPPVYQAPIPQNMNYGILPPRAPEAINPPVAVIPAPIPQEGFIPAEPRTATIIPAPATGLNPDVTSREREGVDLSENKPCLQRRTIPSDALALADPFSKTDHTEELPDGRNAAFDNECHIIGWINADKQTPYKKSNSASLDKSQPPSMGFFPDHPLEHQGPVVEDKEPIPNAAPRQAVQMKPLKFQISF